MRICQTLRSFRRCTVSAAALLGIGLLASTAPLAHAEDAPAADATAAEEGPLSIDLTASVVTDYMFRGQNLYDGIAIQPYAAVTFDTGVGSIGGSLWMHLPAEGDRQDEKFTELDESLWYEIGLEPVTLKVGHLWYTYPDDSDPIKDTAEFFASVALDDSEWNPVSLAPTLTYYKDYREIDYNIFELGMSHKIETDALGKGFNTTPYVTFGFVSNGDTVYEDDGLAYVNVGTSFELALGDITVVPSLNYTFEVDDNTTNEFWAALNFNYSL